MAKKQFDALSFEEIMDELEKSVSDLENGKLPLNKLITRKYSINDINKAFNELSSGKILGRSIIIFD